MRKIVVAGGSGFIGRALVEALLSRGDDVVVLSRGRATAGARVVKWDGKTEGEWARELDGAFAVVNFAGETIQQKWTAVAKDQILRSRVDAVHALCGAIQTCANPPKRWINSSAIGFYGDRGDAILDESSPPGDGFLAETCIAWEGALSQCPAPGTIRTVLRTGMVLGNGGALPTLRKLAKLGLGGAAGTGRQYVSWIHLDDLISMILWALDLAEPPAILNGTSPNALTNREFMRALRSEVRIPFGLPAPAFGVKLVGKLLGPDSDLILSSARVLPREAADRGFRFHFGEIQNTLADLSKRT